MESRLLLFRAYNPKTDTFQQFTLQDIEKQKGKIDWEVLKIDQYTGLRDSKGRKIFENDIIEFKNSRYYDTDPREVITKTFISEVTYKDDCFLVSETQEHDSPLCCVIDNGVIKGNMHQNAALVKDNVYEDPK